MSVLVTASSLFDITTVVWQTENVNFSHVGRKKNSFRCRDAGTQRYFDPASETILRQNITKCDAKR